MKTLIARWLGYDKRLANCYRRLAELEAQRDANRALLMEYARQLTEHKKTTQEGGKVD